MRSHVIVILALGSNESYPSAFQSNLTQKFFFKKKLNLLVKQLKFGGQRKRKNEKLAAYKKVRWNKRERRRSKSRPYSIDLCSPKQKRDNFQNPIYKLYFSLFKSVPNHIWHSAPHI